MRLIKTILSINTAVFILVACGTGAPVTIPTAIATNTLQPTAAEAPTTTPTPSPKDVPVFRTSFEDITDPAILGITADNGTAKITTDNVNYPGGGNQALVVSGILPGAIESRLLANFFFMKLIGKKSLNLSDKTIGFSAFVPEDSPYFENPIVILNNGDTEVNFLVRPVWQEDLEGKQGVWRYYQANLSKIYQDGSWGWTNGTDAEARYAIQHCETLSIGGTRKTAGPAAEAKFYMDDLNWIGSDIYHMPVDDNVDSLRKYAANQHFKIGFYAGEYPIFELRDPWYAYMVVQEGSVSALVDPETKAMQNEDYSNFNWDPTVDANRIRQYQFGESNHLTMLGYSFGDMENEAPQWVRDLPFPESTKALLLHHIEVDLRNTQGENPIWLLFNEFVNDPPNKIYGLRNRQDPTQEYGPWGAWEYSPWAADPTDASLIKAAIIKAREVDPGATLLLNDFYVEQIGVKKSEFLYKFVSDLKQEGIPIDGVGWQMHNTIEPDGKVRCSGYCEIGVLNRPTYDMDTFLKNVDLNVKRYAGRGMKVAFTEIEFSIKMDDIDFNTPAGRDEYERRLQMQAKYYAGLLTIAMENENVILFHMWGVTDRYPGLEYDQGYGNPYIFDRNYYPKPAYTAMLDLLKNH